MDSQHTTNTRKAILITGCSSGIGLASATYLARRGFTVFATVRKGKDEQYLRELSEPNLIPVCPLDLSKPDDIANAIEVVKRGLAIRQIPGLYAVLNNAGGGGIAPIELMDVDRFRVELETRLVGPIALLQGLLPLIRQAHGRILWIVTPAIIPIPYVSSIHICDFAANCIARTLQIELKPWKIPVVQIRCGGIQTSSVVKSEQELEAAFEQWPRERFELYADVLKKEQAGLAKFDQHRTSPDKVAELVYDILNVPKPKRRYQVGYLSGLAAGLEYLPQPMVDAIMERRG